MAFNTNNPLGSTDPRDLSDNSENFDRFANGTDPSYTDRLGNSRKSFSGMESDFQQFLLNSGYEDLGAYASGIEVTARNQIILASGEYWRVAASTSLPYTTTGAGMPEGGAFVSIGDANLRQDLANNTTSLGSDLVAKADTGETVTTALNQRVIYVGSVAELEALSLAVGTNVYLTEEGRAGEFVVKAGTPPSDPQKGFYIVLSNGNYAERVNKSPLDFKWFGADGGGVSDDTVAISACFSMAPEYGEVFVSEGVYSVDNSASDAIVISTRGLNVYGPGKIKATSASAYNCIKVTAPDVTLDSFMVEGPGSVTLTSYDVENWPHLVLFTYPGNTERMNGTCRNLKAINPWSAGLGAFKAVGVDFIDNSVHSDEPTITFQSEEVNYCVRVYSSAFITLKGNTLEGLAEGILVGAYASSTYSFDDFSGRTSNTSRKITVENNVIYRQYDHSIYFSNRCENYIVSGNHLWAASSSEDGAGASSLKMEGIDFVATGNTARDGIVLRNPMGAVISNNFLPLYTPKGSTFNPSKYGILSEDTVFPRPLRNIKISDNRISVESGVDIDGGILLHGRFYDSQLDATLNYQSVVDKISITGNIIEGVGDNSSRNGFGIEVLQDRTDTGGSLSGVNGKYVNIQDNVIQLRTGSLSSYGIRVRNLSKCTITGNNISNIAVTGVRLEGIEESVVADNNISASSTFFSGTRGVSEQEAIANTTIDCFKNKTEGNIYDVETRVVMLSEDGIRRDIERYVDIGTSVGSRTLSSTGQGETFAYGPSGSGADLTIGGSIPFQIGQVILIYNYSTTDSFTVTNDSAVIAAGASRRYVHVGGGTFVNVA